jgi:hypothetical protein
MNDWTKFSDVSDSLYEKEMAKQSALEDQSIVTLSMIVKTRETIEMAMERRCQFEKVMERLLECKREMLE